MQTKATHASGDLARVRTAVPSCSLDEAELAEQQARHARLAPMVDDVRRETEAVLIRFGPGFDREALGELIAVERECCPFFEFDLDESRRSLRVAVSDADHAPALDAIAAQLAPAEANIPEPLQPSAVARSSRDQEKNEAVSGAVLASDNTGSPPTRQIGPVGTVARVAGGLAAIVLPVGLSGLTWWDVGAALVALPLAALLASALVAAAYRRHGADPARAAGAESWIRSTLALALVLGPATAMTFVTPVDGTAIWIFLGFTLLVTAYRGDAGCEVVAIPNALAGRRDPTGCVIFAAIDAAEASHTSDSSVSAQ